MTTTPQYHTINSMAIAAGHQSGYYAISLATGISISRLQRKGYTQAAADATMAFLSVD